MFGQATTGILFHNPTEREQVLTKLNPSLSSLGKEQFPDSGKHLFGDGFEASLKARSETARTVSAANSAGKAFFSKDCLSGMAGPPSRHVFRKLSGPPPQHSKKQLPEKQVQIQSNACNTIPESQIPNRSKSWKRQSQPDLQILSRPVMNTRPFLPTSRYLPFIPLLTNLPIACRLPNWELITQDPWGWGVGGGGGEGDSVR